LDKNNADIADLTQRLGQVPGSMVGLEALNRDYQTKKVLYDDLLKKKEAISLSARANQDAQGESLQVIDPANMPQKPIAPKRGVLIGVGLAVGLGFGLLCAAAFEGPRLLTIQTVEDVRHYTNLPVLVTVPELLTPQEARAAPRRRLLLLTAGVVVTLLSIPALALALRFTHIFDRFVS
ncbi:MAG TPA: GNVR domain-containing protein, partial [Pyrinomonadaceae bacterium]